MSNNTIRAGLIARSAKKANALGRNFITQIIERDCTGKHQFETVDFDDMATGIYLRGVYFADRDHAYGIWQDIERPHIGIALLWGGEEQA